MYVKCYELMKLPTFKYMQLVAGATGLNRLVSWVYVLSTPSLGDWVHGGELVFVVHNEDLKQVLQDGLKQEIAGVVVLKNKENKSVLNEDHVDFANLEKLPLFEMDYNVKLVDVTREISGFIMKRKEKIDYVNHFFHNILFSEKLEQKDIDDFSLHYGFHSDHQFFITTIHSDDVSKLNDVQQLLERYIDDGAVRYLMMNLNSYLVVLAYSTEDTVKKAKTMLKSSFSMLNERFPGLLFMAMGNTTNSLHQIRSSYQNSMKAVDLCVDEIRVVDYEKLGFSRLLLNVPKEELEAYATFVLGDVKEYDEKNESSFLDTMEAYILCNGSVSKTSAQLYIHKNTCIYRIARINEVFGIDLNDATTRAEILNSLVVFRFLGEME